MNKNGNSLGTFAIMALFINTMKNIDRNNIKFISKVKKIATQLFH